MAKHTQKIRRQFADKLFECVWPFCGIVIQILISIASTNGSVFRKLFPFRRVLLKHVLVYQHNFFTLQTELDKPIL